MRDTLNIQKRGLEIGTGVTVLPETLEKHGFKITRVTLKNGVKITGPVGHLLMHEHEDGEKALLVPAGDGSVLQIPWFEVVDTGWSQ